MTMYLIRPRLNVRRLHDFFSNWMSLVVTRSDVELLR